MREQILQEIYKQFETWSKGKADACGVGCVSCCTQNVTVTATEAELIHKWILKEGKTEWLADKLASQRNSEKPKMTTNDFAKACLEGKEVDPGQADNLTPCPFLERGCCQIYEVRPYSCRAFISAKRCSSTQPAIMTEQYAAATTAVSQIIEHLGQKEYWGNLFDVLTAMTDISAYKESSAKLSPEHIMECRMRTLTAKPLVGFLLTEEDMAEAEPILQAIFSAKIDNKTIEDILNGK